VIAMRVFLAGAAGAIGKRLVPLLIQRGHQVVALTRDPSRAPALRAAGALPVIADALDGAAVRAAVLEARPEVIVHQLTALGRASNLRNFDREFAATNRLRTTGTEHLLAGARAAGARRFVAQSYAGWPYDRHGGPIKTEGDPLDPHPPRTMSRSLQAIRRLESLVLEATDLEGVVLRYGSFYGPGTALADGGELATLVRRRRFPTIGAGSGVWSFIHMDDAAAATALAVEGHGRGVYNVVDDDPAPVSAWLPDLARALGAPPPRHLPRWLGRLLAGEAVVSMMTRPPRRLQCSRAPRPRLDPALPHLAPGVPHRPGRSEPGLTERPSQRQRPVHLAGGGDGQATSSPPSIGISAPVM
jgi:nucleoside-diphosphate-sugar epimerase